MQLLHPAGLRIEPGLAEQALLGHAAVLAQRREADSGWTWYRLAPWSDARLRLCAELGFEHGALRECRLSHDDSRYGSHPDDGSERKELQRARALRDWLAAHGCAVGRHAWGEAWVDYDPRVGLCGAGLRYGGTRDGDEGGGGACAP